MARKKPSRRARALGKHAERYAHELKTVRRVFKDFDAKKFDAAQVAVGRSPKARKEAAKIRAKVRRRFNAIRPYVNRGVKFLAPKKREHFDRLREAVGVKKFSNMRAIPMPTQAKRVRVRFDRKGRPIISEDGVRNTYFLFPRVPRARQLPGPLGTRRFLDAQDDAVEMLRAMLPTMPPGYYVFLTRHNFLIPQSGDRDRLESMVRELYSSYGNSPEFLKLFVGFRYITDSEEEWFRIKQEMSSERARLKGVRRRQRVGRRLKEIIAMDKQLKSGKPLSRGQISRRARLTGRR